MRILVIGGTGFIGACIVSQLASHGHTIAIYHRGKTHSDLPEHIQHIIDPRSVMPVRNFPPSLLDFAPDVVIHTIAMGAADAEAAVKTFAGHAGRLVLLSSGDVYRAYGRFTNLEPGPIEHGLLSEDAPLRTVLFPYRAQAASHDALQYWYEKILAERAALSDPRLPATVLRLPKVYGPGGNENLATVYAYRNHPDWRWTHGFVENVAAAVVLAATHPAAVSRIYNVGEANTPTVSERLRTMPPSTIAPDENCIFNFEQNIAFDTTRIRIEFGYSEIVPEEEAMRKTLQCCTG
jgi:nucleoside-diphosphate-sugar epimerase